VATCLKFFFGFSLRTNNVRNNVLTDSFPSREKIDFHLLGIPCDNVINDVTDWPRGLASIKEKSWKQNKITFKTKKSSFLHTSVSRLQIFFFFGEVER
jgi:hypothetical protein